MPKADLPHDYTKSPSLDNANKIWLFTLGQPLDEAKNLICSNGYDFIEDEYGIKGNQVVSYMGYEWDRFDLAKGANGVIRVFFRKSTPYTLLSETEKSSLVAQLDNIYGEHKLDRTSGGGSYQFWSWDNEKIHVSLSCLDDLGSQELVFEK